MNNETKTNRTADWRVIGLELAAFATIIVAMRWWTWWH